MGKGCQIFLCDYSPAMLAAARADLLAAGPGDGELTFVEASAGDLPGRFGAGFFDLVLCHTLLDYVDNPEVMVAGLSWVLRQGGFFSCVVANRFSEAFRRAIRDQDPGGAASAIDEEMFSAGLFQDIRRRAFSFGGLRDLLSGGGLTPVIGFGIRVFADFFPNERFREEDFYGRVLELERRAMDRDPYRQVGRYIHMIARK
jgi:S-adenosylmethionine-dependent methyltransferase